MAGEIYLAMGVGGIAVMGTAIYFMQREKRTDKTHDTPIPKNDFTGQPAQSRKTDYVEVDLEEACDIWTDKVIPLVQACVLWTDPPNRQEEPLPRPSFSHSEIDIFYTEMVENRKSVAGRKRALISAILQTLDEHGDCSSVVRNAEYHDNDNKRDDQSFRLLSIVPLYKHSLAVAKAMALRVGRETLVPDALIVSLAHDIGKIPAFHKTGYSTGDHPRHSGFCIAEMKEFKELVPRNQEELLAVIKGHHDLNISNPITQLLQTCDGLVRNTELSELLKQEPEIPPARAKAENNTGDKGINAAIKWVNLDTPEEKPAAQEPAPEPQQTEVSVPTPPVSEPERMEALPPELPLTVEAQQPAVEQPKNNTVEEKQCNEQPPLLPLPDKANEPKETKAGGYAPKRIALDWFQPEAFLESLKPWINYVHEKQWGAVSTPDGMVYVNGDCLWGVLKNVTPDEFKADYLNASANEGRKRDLLYSVVWELSEQKNAIAVNLMKPQYYSIPVTVITGSGSVITGKNGSQIFLTPFRAESFGVLPSELEKKKTAELRRLVKTIKPKMAELK